MDQHSCLTLWCFLEGDKNPFCLVVRCEQNVYQLKGAVRGEKQILRDFDTDDVVLLKVMITF